MPRRTVKKQKSSESQPMWSPDTELVGLVFELVSSVNVSVYPQYTVGLHAWFLDQVRSQDPELSAYLHDGESEKPFTISALDGEIVSSGREVQLQANTIYRWYVTALSGRVVQWLLQWLSNLPREVNLRNASLQIRSCQIFHPPTTYEQLLTCEHQETVNLQFLSPTSFRRKGHHFP